MGKRAIIEVRDLVAGYGEDIILEDVTFDIMQHGVHQCQTVSIANQFDACECLATLEGLLLCGDFEIVIMFLFKILIGYDHKSKGAALKSLLNVPACSLKISR